MQVQDLRVAVLCFEEHVFGRLIVKEMLRVGIVPRVVIQEPGKLAERRVGKYVQFTPPESLPGTFAELLEGQDCEIVYVENSNDEAAEEALRRHNLDLLVLGGARIIKPNILSIPKSGVLNLHPGLLPKMRGSMPTIWSIVYDYPQGVSCHFVDEDLDTGNLLKRVECPVYRGQTYPQVFHSVNQLSAEVIVSVLVDYCTNGGHLEATPQPPCEDGWCNNWPEDKVFEEAERKLREQTYACFAD